MVVDGCQGPECFRGMFPDVFHEIQGIMNFTYTMHMPEDGEWGAKREDGSWTGIIGEIMGKKGKTCPKTHELIQNCEIYFRGGKS